MNHGSQSEKYYVKPLTITKTERKKLKDRRLWLEGECNNKKQLGFRRVEHQETKNVKKGI